MNDFEDLENHRANKPSIYPEKVESAYPLKITDVAVEVGMPVGWVFETTQTLGIEAEWDYFNGISIPHYPSYAVEVLREEMQSQQEMDKTSELVTNHAISKITGRSTGWIQKKLDDLGYEPVRTEDYRSETVRTRRLYDRNALVEIRDLSMSMTRAFGRMTISQIEHATGVSHKRIKKILAEHGIHPLHRRDKDNGLTVMTYPPEAVDVIEKDVQERPRFGGDWLTKNAIAGALGKTFGWVSRHIGDYQHLAEERQDDSGRTKPHYPPQVLDILRQKIDELKTLKEKGDYLTVHDISLALDKNWRWVKDGLRELAIKAETRLDNAGTPRKHYPPEVLKILDSISKKRQNDS
jgi:hypothetical protein